MCDFAKTDWNEISLECFDFYKFLLFLFISNIFHLTNIPKVSFVRNVIKLNIQLFHDSSLNYNAQNVSKIKVVRN